MADQAKHARRSSIEVGDTVLMEKPGLLTKLDTPYQDVEYLVVDREGSKVLIIEPRTHSPDRLLRETSHI